MLKIFIRRKITLPENCQKVNFPQTIEKTADLIKKNQKALAITG